MAEKKIGGRTFRCSPMLAMDALRLQARLLKVLGPAMGQVGAILALRSARKGREASPEDEARENAAALQAFTALFGNVDPEELATLVKNIVEIAQIRRDSGQYDQVDLDGDFTGKQGDLIPVVMFVLTEQFEDFIKGLMALGGPKLAAVA